MSASLKFLDDDREPTDFEIAQLILDLKSSSTALVDVTDIVDHLRRQLYVAGRKAASIVNPHVVKLPSRMPLHDQDDDDDDEDNDEDDNEHKPIFSLRTFPINFDLFPDLS